MSMTFEELKTAVVELSAEQKKQFILETLPDLGREAIQDPSFLPQLLPVFLGLIRDSGIDLNQLLQLANLLGATSPAGQNE